MRKYLLSIDDGGTYIKAALFDFLGRQISIAKQYNELLCPEPGRTEYDQDVLWQINCNCIRGVLEQARIDPAEIACIGIAAQGCGFYGVDAQGESIRNAITSSDQRAQAIVERWEADGTNRAMYDRIFRLVTAGQTNAILAWLKENEPENYARIRWVFSMKDLLIYRLTGRAVSGYGCASASCLMDMRTRRIEPDLAAAFGIGEMAECYGPMFWDAEACGVVSEEAAGQCGLTPGTPVASGSHDVVASALAMGIADPGHCFMIAGTHGINGCVSSVPVDDGSIKYNELFALPGRFLVEEAYPSSAGTLEWAIDLLFGVQRGEKLYEQMNRAVEEIPPDADLPIFLPYLRGHRDNPYARGSWQGLLPGHGRGHLLRAVYEGVAFAHRLQMEHVLRGREQPPAIRFAGGAANSAVWTQIFADAFGIPMEVVPGQEMGAKGAAIVASVAAGIHPDVESAVEHMVRPGALIEPRQRYAQAYERRYARFRQLAENGDVIWNEAAERTEGSRGSKGSKN